MQIAAPPVNLVAPLFSGADRRCQEAIAGDLPMNALRIRALVATALLTNLTQIACADSLPPGLIACSKLSDVLQRLACYDKEIARVTQESPPLAAATPAATTTPVAQTKPGTKPAGVTHVAAHIVSIEGGGDSLVVHLDNGQVWKQVEKADATLGLRVGDRVTIDRGFGESFWLSGPSQATMQVKLATT
jgi:hypothetical protein